MNYFKRLPQQARIVLAVGASVLLLILVYTLLALVGSFIDNNSRVNQLEPRIARLQGYAGSEKQLRLASREIVQRLNQVAYPRDTDSDSIGTQIQQQLRAYADAAGLKVTGGQLLSAKRRDGFEELRVNLKLSGSLVGYEHFLSELQKAQPLLWVRSLNISAARTVRGDDNQTLTASVSISAARVL